MRAFGCPRCAGGLVFEDLACRHCRTPVAWSRTERRLVVAERERRCVNTTLNGCNWLADPDSPRGFCLSCQLTRTRPADHDAPGLAGYAEAEAAKRRLVYELDELGLPVPVSDGYLGLAFDLLSSGSHPVTTGYHNGVITLDLAEARPDHRERLRQEFGEPHRTVLGHLRHEIGHYYAETLLLTTPRRPEFVAVFGEPGTTYGTALARHYAAGAPADWPERHITAYASMHPLEDFAEVFAHVLQISAGLQTAVAYGLLPAPAPGQGFAPLVTDTWLPVATALNQVARSLGHEDAYPFAPTGAVLAKLEFVADLIGAPPTA